MTDRLILRPPPPFPQRLKRKDKYGKFLKFISMLCPLSVNILLVEALDQMPGYGKFMKDLVTKKRTVTSESNDGIIEAFVEERFIV
ncbi:hypothetical protein H5410_040572 [Solanum commersonii]|uniref:Uncharacterized protein n=1 Tax=Solanum commersonii TaxID=4109 RepID=A0A9J5XQI3_SOLCO|nr:hypothetical protein H5410_040572 [Solanum commersonii]